MSLVKNQKKTTLEYNYAKELLYRGNSRNSSLSSLRTSI
jgi:hypothetical protein